MFVTIAVYKKLKVHSLSDSSEEIPDSYTWMTISGSYAGGLNYVFWYQGADHDDITITVDLQNGQTKTESFVISNSSKYLIYSHFWSVNQYESSIENGTGTHHLHF